MNTQRRLDGLEISAETETTKAIKIESCNQHYSTSLYISTARTEGT